jgi:hypothetical protein
MDSVFDSKLTIGAAAVGAVALGVLAVLHLLRADLPHVAAPAPRASVWNGPIGPGRLTGPLPELPPLGAELQAAPDSQLAVDSAGHLVPDFALRTLLESFLARATGPQRQAKATELRAYLKSRLKAPAAEEAERILTDYLSYLDANEQMLARERFSPPNPAGLSETEVEHLLAWQRLRAQLRQRMLGLAVSQSWFEGEERFCDSALHEWQQQRQPPDPAEEPDPVTRRESRVHAADLDARRDYNAQVCAGQISERLAAGG